MRRKISIKPGQVRRNKFLGTIVAYMQLHPQDIYSLVAPDFAPELSTIEATAKDFAAEIFYSELHPVELRRDDPMLTPDRYERGGWYLKLDTKDICYANTSEGVDRVVFSYAGIATRA